MHPYIIIISLFAVVITTHLKIKIQTSNEMVKALKLKVNTKSGRSRNGT